MTEQPILFEIDARGIATLTFNRPDALNTYNDGLLAAMKVALDQIENDPRVRLMVLRGNGKHFCAGADIKWLNESDKSGAERLSPTPLVAQINTLVVPTIALVHGACIGGGVAWIASCDVVIAENSSVYSIPEVRLGFVPGTLLTSIARAMTPRDMRRYALSGERFGAPLAREMGLIHETCEAGALDAAAAPLVDAFLRGGPEALAATKALIAEVSDNPPSAERNEKFDRIGAESRGSAEAAEGRASFLEKRDPHWYR